MTVAGFSDAYTDAVRVRVNGMLTVPVVSPSGLVLLKLIAWQERHVEQPGRDAADIAYVLRHYGEIITEDTLFNTYLDAMQAVDYDIDLAAARVLGRRVRQIVTDSLPRLMDLIRQELEAGCDAVLVREVAATMAPVDAEYAYQLLTQFGEGLHEA